MSSKWWLRRGGEGEEKVVQVASAVDPEIAPEPEQEEYKEFELRWKDLADRGELCVYTCLSFKTGGRSDVSNLVPQLTAIVALQVMVPALMLFHEMKAVHSAIRSFKHLEFRIVGFILYLYSIRSMFNNCVTECRSIFLEVAFQYNLPIPYVWPLVLGELINAFCSFTLCLTLFTIFCQAHHLPDLLINCIAINFIGNVDNEFVTEDLKKKAADNFHKINQYLRSQKGLTMKYTMRRVLEKGLDQFLRFTRVGGTLCCGTCLAFVFLLSHATFFCDYFHLDGGFLC